MNAIMRYFEHSLALPFFGIGLKAHLFQSLFLDIFYLVRYHSHTFISLDLVFFSFLNMFKSFHLNDSDNLIQKHFVIYISGLQTKDSVDKVTRHGECNVFSGQMTHVSFGCLYQLPFSCRERKGEFDRL